MGVLFSSPRIYFNISGDRLVLLTAGRHDEADGRVKEAGRLLGLYREESRRRVS